MLKVDSKKACSVVYSLCHHPYLGYLIEPHIVQLNPQGDFSLSYQRLFSLTAKDYAKHLTELDFKLIKLLDETEQDYIIKRYFKKTIRANEFFEKHFNSTFYEQVRPKLDKHLVTVLELLKNEGRLYLMGKDGWPAEQKIELATEAMTVLFHFRRNETETRYFPTLKYRGLRVDFMFKDAKVISNLPAWLLLEHTLYYFEQEVDGKKLIPFLNKRFISIPKTAEEAYFHKFIAPLIERYHVYAEGFEIKALKSEPIPTLKLIYVENGVSQAQLYFRYNDYGFSMGDENKVSVKIQRQGEQYTFYRIKRNIAFEQEKYNTLLDMGLQRQSPLFYNLELRSYSKQHNTSYAIFAWLNENADRLAELGFVVEQSSETKKFVLGSSRINFDIKDNNDWFDIEAIVYFGEHAVPFIALKQHILHKKREYILPNGGIAIIPETWFTQYGSLFKLSTDSKRLQLRKHHIGLVHDLAEGGIAQLSLDRKMQKLNEFEQIADFEMPQHFNGALRHYQKAGYNWFNFLRQYQFGGCLADDMGLGKTIQTLALLQKTKEEQDELGHKATSLIVMPTSLIYNWAKEAKKFTPQLKILIHTGINRAKDLTIFSRYDLVITTYGIVRIDVEHMEHFYFNYIILDESQNIKNPSSKAFKAVRQLKSKYRLALSGTPIENSVNDLWSQLTFLNPGILGSHHYFNEEFVQAIEKRKEEDKSKKLLALIKPFVLRRTKEQVAAELPPKTEQLIYCDMSEEQAKRYETTKSAYRNDLLINGEQNALAQKQIQLLQGLTALRQLANHPAMIDPHYNADSGKLENVLYTLDNVLKGGHKVLIFSQFVRHLDLMKRELDKAHISYAYLDGSTRNRGDVVAEFQENDTLKVFLISIKAGGVGLNLTQADYVFILDPWWNPAVEQQAIDRTHRIGQKKKVFIYKFISKDTVEEKILALQQRKQQLASSLITTEESFFKSLSKEDIKELLS